MMYFQLLDLVPYSFDGHDSARLPEQHFVHRAKVPPPDLAPVHQILCQIFADSNQKFIGAREFLVEIGLERTSSSERHPRSTSPLVSTRP